MPQSDFAHLKQSYEHKPLMRHFNMELLHAADDGATLRLPFSERIVNLAGTVEGGVLATLVDTACSVAYEWGLDTADVAITVDLRIDYVAPLTAGHSAIAEAQVVHRGRTIGRCQVTIVEEGSRKLLARGLTVFVIRQRQRW